ncbi:hypothetical protein, partial [Providencia rettgeri]
IKLVRKPPIGWLFCVWRKKEKQWVLRLGGGPNILIISKGVVKEGMEHYPFIDSANEKLKDPRVKMAVTLNLISYNTSNLIYYLQ